MAIRANAHDPVDLPPLVRRLSARLLALTVLLVLLGEVLIYVPSIARFRVVYLSEKLAAAHLATAVLLADPEAMLDPAAERRLLDQAGLTGVVVRDGPRVLALGAMPPAAATYDLDAETVLDRIVHAFATLVDRSDRLIRIVGASPRDPDVVVDLTMPRAPLCDEMLAYSGRILTLSLFLSALVAGSLFLLLQRLIVRPMRQLTASVMAFRENPEDPDAVVATTRRQDELGVVQREIRRMQRRVRDALRQRERLAALGAAVGKINHDLRNVLGTAMLLSDRLEKSEDPQVRKTVPRLFAALERATALCAETLAYAKSETPELKRERVLLHPFVHACAEGVTGFGERWRLRNDVPGTLAVNADRAQLDRVFTNLVANAAQAMGEAGGLVAVQAWREDGWVVVEVADTGPGVPESVRPQLFAAFVGTARPGGTGLGLHIARDIARRHGGDLRLHRTGGDGTAFRLLLKDAGAKMDP